MSNKTKINNLLEALNEGVFEKEEAIRLTLLTSIAGESIFFLGLPGVAKSLIARRLKFAFKDAKSFEYLMNRFSTPDEVFGPISVTELQNDNYKRITENYLPDAEIVFLDEIWKAGAAIQNTLLTVLNEKIFRNGKEEVKVKLKGLIAASNELPPESDGHGDSVEALWDRFLIRLIITSVEDEDNFNRMISDDLKPTVDNVKSELKISDTEYHTWEKEVDIMDCFLIKDCVWNDETEIETVKNIVSESIREYGYNLTVDISSVDKQVKELDKDVKKEAEYERPYEVTQNKVYNKDFYKLIGLQQYPQYSWIKKDDFKKINEQQQSFYFYDAKGQNSQNWGTRKDSNGIHVGEYNWSVCQVETEIVVKKELKTRRPDKRLIKAFDKEVIDIKTEIEKQIETINKHIEEKLNHLQTNLFVDKLLASIVEENLHNSVQELQNLRIEVEKIKSFYDGLE